MRIEVLYHWSPSENRRSILQYGLQLYSPPVVHSGIQVAPYLCFGVNPLAAWSLSGSINFEYLAEIENWDLWQVFLAETDSVCVLPHWGPEIREVRTRNSIPADRCHYLATRGALCFEDVNEEDRREATETNPGGKDEKRKGPESQGRAKRARRAALTRGQAFEADRKGV